LEGSVFRIKKQDVLKHPPEKKIMSKVDLASFIQAQIGETHLGF
jgi:hypothetical protein